MWPDAFRPMEGEREGEGEGEGEVRVRLCHHAAEVQAASREGAHSPAIW